MSQPWFVAGQCASREVAPGLRAKGAARPVPGAGDAVMWRGRMSVATSGVPCRECDQARRSCDCASCKLVGFGVQRRYPEWLSTMTRSRFSRTGV